MRLAASNIGWAADQDNQVLRYMADHEFEGLEIAPTRIFPDAPYNALAQASEYAISIKAKYGLGICSMQSIWFGQTQKIIESSESRKQLLDYTKKAIQFADAIGCTNLVFGCPRNRAISGEKDIPCVEDFLWQCAEAANPYGVIFALEANPLIYHTNFINTTEQAVELIKRLNHPALKLNLDVGTVIENKEGLGWIANNGSLIHHVHISEPHLAPVQDRAVHEELLQLLKATGYNGYIAIEMKQNDDVLQIQNAIQYVYKKASEVYQ